MSLSIQEMDALWNKYESEFNRIPTSHHQLMAFAKTTGATIKFLDARKYFEMRKSEQSQPNSSSNSHKDQSRNQREKFTRKNKNAQKKQKHRRNSSLPQLESQSQTPTKSTSFFGVKKSKNPKKEKPNKDKKSKKPKNKLKIKSKDAKRKRKKSSTSNHKRKRKKSAAKKPKKKSSQSKDHKHKKNKSKTPKNKAKIKPAHTKPTVKKMDANAWIKDKNTETQTYTAPPKPKKLTNWVNDDSNVTNTNGNIKVSQIKPKPKPILAKSVAPKKKVINSWVKSNSANLPQTQARNRPLPAVPHKAYHSNTASPVSPESNNSHSYSSAQSPVKKQVSFKIHQTSPNLSDRLGKNPNRSNSKKKVVFNDADNTEENRNKKKKKKKKGYLSFFGRKKNKKKKVELSVSNENETSDMRPMAMARNLSISQSSTENVNDDGSKVRPSMKDSQSEKAPNTNTVRPMSARQTQSKNNNQKMDYKRSGSVFSFKKHSNNETEDVSYKKEWEQLKKIRKSELKQLNSMKKENKSLSDKYGKLGRENKNFKVQIKQLKEALKSVNAELDEMKKNLEFMRKNNGELIHKNNDSETKNKKLQNTITAKDNEVRILTADAQEYKRQIIQIMDLQNQNDKKIFTSLQTQNETLKEEVFRYRKDIETLNNKLIDLDNLKMANDKLDKDKDETKKKYLYFKDKLDKITTEKNQFESEHSKEKEQRLFLESQLSELQTKYGTLQQKHFERGKNMETELNLLREQQELEKEMDQTVIAQQRQQLEELTVSQRNLNSQSLRNLNSQSERTLNGNETGMTAQQNWEYQQQLYAQEQYRRQQQWMQYQQQQQQQMVYQQMFQPPPAPPSDNQSQSNIHSNPGSSRNMIINENKEDNVVDGSAALPDIANSPKIVNGGQSEASIATVVIDSDAQTTKSYYDTEEDSRYESGDEEYSGDSEETDSDSEYTDSDGSYTHTETESESDSGDNEYVDTGYDQ